MAAEKIETSTGSIRFRRIFVDGSAVDPLRWFVAGSGFDRLGDGVGSHVPPRPSGIELDEDEQAE